MLLYLSHPHQGLSRILQLIDTFSKASGLRINWNKSEDLLLGLSDSTILGETPLKWAHDHILYLGVNVCIDRVRLLSLNLTPLLDSYSKKTDRWPSFSISMMGRIALRKMLLLPKFLYIFANLPLCPPTDFFPKRSSIVFRLVWANKSPRASKSTLVRRYVSE